MSGTEKWSGSENNEFCNRQWEQQRGYSYAALDNIQQKSVKKNNIYCKLAISFDTLLGVNERKEITFGITRLSKELGLTVISVNSSRNWISVIVNLPLYLCLARIERIIMLYIRRRWELKATVSFEPLLFNSGIILFPEPDSKSGI
ncbi:MAG: hypothetical protein QW728_00470 [Thermoplasmata archaeon]